MLSRETAVHVSAVSVALAILVAASYADVGVDDGPAWVAFFVLFYGLVLGGAHLYFALRGEDGMIPVEARWRYVATLAVVLVSVAIVASAGDRTVGALEVRTVAGAVAGLAIAVYLGIESVAGYRATRPE